MRILLYLLMVFVFAFSTESCKKKKSNPSPTPTGDTGTFSATVSGSPFVATSSKAVLTKSNLGSGDNYTFYFESKNSSNNKMMDFFLYSSTEFTAGTYTITLGNAGQAYYFENKDQSNEKIWIAPKPASSNLTLSYGTVEITEITTNRAKGNFSFTSYSYTGLTGADSTRVVSSATFDVPMTRQGF